LKNIKIQQMFRDIDVVNNNIQPKNPQKEEAKSDAKGEEREEGEIFDKPEELPATPTQYDLDMCMDDPLFAGVVEMMLKIVGVRDEEGNSIA
jgi:hypothetical protein